MHALGAIVLAAEIAVSILAEIIKVARGVA